VMVCGFMGHQGGLPADPSAAGAGGP
jgi:hypothetical protein